MSLKVNSNMWLCATCTTPNYNEKVKCEACGDYRNANDAVKTQEIKFGVDASWVPSTETNETKSFSIAKFGFETSSVHVKQNAKATQDLQNDFSLINAGRITFGSSNPLTFENAIEASFLLDPQATPVKVRNEHIESLYNLPLPDEVTRREKGNGTVYTWGSGECDQQALNASVMNECLCQPTPHSIKAFSSFNVISICAGSMASFAIVKNDDAYEIYSWGCSDQGVLGRPLSQDEFDSDIWRNVKKHFPSYRINKCKVPTPIPVKFRGMPVKIIAGDSFACLLTSKGEIYAWGSFRDYSGPLGFKLPNGDVVDFHPVATKIDVFGHAIDLVGGENHFIALVQPTEKVSQALSPFLVVCGSSEFGQIFLPPQNRTSTDSNELSMTNYTVYLQPVKIELKDLTFHKLAQTKSHENTFKEFLLNSNLQTSGIVQRIFAGKCTSFILVSLENKEYLFGVGRNSYAELGAGYQESIVSNPTLIPISNIESPYKIQGGDFTTTLLTNKGDLYVCGKSILLGIGIKDSKAVTDSFTLISVLKNKVKSIACGTKSTYAISFDGHLLAWGENDTYQIGDGSEGEERCTPVLLKHEHFDNLWVSQVAAGAQHAIAMCVKSSFPTNEAIEYISTPTRVAPHESHVSVETKNGLDVPNTSILTQRKRKRSKLLGLDIDDIDKTLHDAEIAGQRNSRKRLRNTISKQ